MTKLRQKLTPQLIEQARTARAGGFSWGFITKTFNVSPYLLRCALDEAYRAHKQATAARWRSTHLRAVPQCRKKPALELKRPPPDHPTTAWSRVPEHVLRERDRHAAALERRTAAQVMLGDPPEGWRALDRRKAG